MHGDCPLRWQKRRPCSSAKQGQRWDGIGFSCAIHSITSSESRARCQESDLGVRGETQLTGLSRSDRNFALSDVRYCRIPPQSAPATVGPGN
eukprot:757894-Hanusia_phi.AAC.2